MAPQKKQIKKHMLAMEIVDGELHPTYRPLPKPARGEVLIRVHAAGVNRPDLLQRQGHYPPPPGITDIPGLEVAGEIIKGPRQGEKVCALVAGGGYAEYVCVPAAHCLPIPRGMTMMAAAALPETFFTVWRNVFDIGRLQKGEWLLIHGGNSGIGTTAIQLARARGAKVIATVRGAAKAKACAALGAHHVIDTAKKDFVAEVLRLSKNRGVDVVLDMLGGETVGKNIAVLAPLGRHVSIALLTGRMAAVDIRTLMQKQIILTGSTLRPQPVAVKAAIAKALKKDVWPLLATGKIAPVIAKTFPLAQAQAAHDLLESGKVTGKIVLIV